MNSGFGLVVAAMAQAAEAKRWGCYSMADAASGVIT